ncbi:VOC family protein [Proteiniclasticum sp.]|uniref:VOC family protein n=1 Tax=Proteiniclasticum sp. TaxID=2053595 RepID=UPI00289F1A43|nr:VOC family protein [Proteiniclasticum sp.]
MKTVPYTTGSPKLSQKTRLGVVHLKVKHLKEQIAFYQEVLKMTLHEESEDHAVLGDTSKPLLHLRKVDDLKRYSNTTGMYHFALLYPSEKELAKAISWLYSLSYPNYPTDHGMSKTTYLKDLEGNDIELYIRTGDRGNYVSEDGELKFLYNDGTLTEGRDPLDLEELYRTLKENENPGTPLENMEMGHIHLYASSLSGMLTFYRDVIGFSEGLMMPGFRMGDVGLEEAKYHVVAFNTWKGTDLPAPKDAAGLDYYTLILDGKEEYLALKERLKEADVETFMEDDGEYLYDPAHIRIRLKTDHE